MRARVRAVALTLLLLIAAAASTTAATSSIVVTMDVASSTSLVNGCTAAPATQLGTALPGTAARTASGTGVCRVTFGSSNATAQLRVGQADGTGSAMSMGMQAPTLQARDSAPGRMSATFGASSTLAYIAGRGAVIMRTTNGGDGWTEFASSGSFNDVEMLPGSTATWWFVGDARNLRRTTDGLAAAPTFAAVTSLGTAGWPSTVNINGISIPDASTIVVVGDSRWIARSTDAGSTWSAFQHGNTAVGNLVAVDAASSSVLHAVTSTGRVLTTTTGGGTAASWAVAEPPGAAGRRLDDVAMGAANRSTVVGDGGYVATWDGTTWTDRTAQLGMPLHLTGAAVRPGESDGAWVVDEHGGVWSTLDRGATWSHRGSDSAARLGDIHFATATDAYVAGAERVFPVSHDGGVSFSVTWGPGQRTLAAIAASPVDGQRAIAVGSRGDVLRTTDGGATWSATTSSGRGLFSVAMADDSRAWAVGDRARIQQTVDGGATWAAQPPPAGVSERLTGIVAVDRYRLVAVGMHGRIVRSVNGGDSWTTVSSPTTGHLLGVAGSGDTLLAVGGRGVVLRSTDAGASWAQVPGASLPDPMLGLVAVAMTSTNRAYVSAAWNDVWRSDDGGTSWAQVAGGTATQNRAIAAVGERVVVAGLDDSHALSANGGATFQRAVGPTGMHLRGVAAVDTHVAWMVGADGVRLRTAANGSAVAQVADWSPPGNSWTAGGFFGVCLQAVGGGASANWTVDATNVAGMCEALDSDPWRAVPATTATGLAAQTSAPGTGSVDLVWGFRPKADQAPGTYEAGIVFEAIAP